MNKQHRGDYGNAPNTLPSPEKGPVDPNKKTVASKLKAVKIRKKK